ncbi:MAG: phosphoribosylformylglycinamidine synthase subunit PurQ [Deltaproteobacteria bacterium]|nr:phosphoribosylformylglycinamidine synthase subunit PurQ [Deltaproteobacteria bacterium]
MTVAVVTFPGSNCDRDCVSAVKDALGASVVRAWHKDAALPAQTSSVILPGGFSYGDYLRCGAMAALSPIMAAVKRFADAGGPVLGICNGFQILCEAKLLPGALLRNNDGLFHCEDVELEVCAGGRGLLAPFDRHQRITLPIAHGEGNYFADDATLDRLEAEERVAFRYVARDAKGNGAVNGARRGIAGVIGGPAHNVVGLMPHPERRSGTHLHGSDGLLLLRGLVAAGAGRAEVRA